VKPNLDPPAVPGEGSAPSAQRSSPATLDFALLRGALDEIPFGVAATRDGALLYANEALSRILGAPPGGLEHKPLGELFDPVTFETIAGALADARVYSGRVRARTFAGEPVDVDVHLESYRSEAQGQGGFVVMRDVTLELGALGRLVDQLGGAIFRVRVETGALEMLSPAIAQLTGLDAERCLERPVILTSLVSSEERERVAFLYRRLVRGELPSATAQIGLRRLDGASRLVRIVATSRRDVAGVVRHIDGVVIDAVHEHAAATRHDAPAAESRDPAGRATMDLTYEVLREASPHFNALQREARALRHLVSAQRGALRPEVAAELLGRIDALASAAHAASSLSRGARHALARASLGATLGEILDGLRGTLGPAIGEALITIDAGDASSVVISERVDEIALALTHLSLRAFRFAGSGSLRLTARRTPAPAPALRAIARGFHRGPEREHAFVEIAAAAPADLADSAMEISSDVIRSVPRPDETDLAYAAAQALLGVCGGAIESDDAGFSSARTVVRLRG
jgi:PAS domain S-box-containing protein